MQARKPPDLMCISERSHHRSSEGGPRRSQEATNLLIKDVRAELVPKKKKQDGSPRVGHQGQKESWICVLKQPGYLEQGPPLLEAWSFHS